MNSKASLSIQSASGERRGQFRSSTRLREKADRKRADIHQEAKFNNSQVEPAETGIGQVVTRGGQARHLLASRRSSARTRHLLAIFSPWRSLSEMHAQDADGHGLPDISSLPESQASCASVSTIADNSRSGLRLAQDSRQRSTDGLARTMHLQVAELPVLASTYPVSESTALADNPEPTDGSVANEHLRQAVVLPLLLCCLIFVAAIWTKQISFALKNDTLMKFVALGLVFICMAAIACWLSRDAQISDEDLVDTHETYLRAAYQLQQCSFGLPIPYQNFQLQQQQGCLSHASQLDRGQLSAAVHKSTGCNISIIDCHPPDYQSALLNSSPLLYSPNEQVGKKSDKHGRLTDNPDNGKAQDSATLQSMLNSNDTREFSQLHAFNLPPSYEDSTSSRK